MRGALIVFAIVAFVIALDQLTKSLIATHLMYAEHVPVLPFFSWVHLRNDGAAFSFLQGAGGWQRWFLVFIAAAFSSLLVFEIRKLKPDEHWQRFAFAMILGGALGNLSDRVVYGYVVDFVLVHWQEHYFPAFNIADSAIFIGAVVWIVLILFAPRARETST